MRGSILLTLMVLCGACSTTRAPGPPTPDAGSTRWRALVGCYRMGDGEFALDSVPDLKLNSDRPGVRRVTFSPTPAIVGGYWFVSTGGAVWVVRHDGLWGRSYEFAVRGDSLVGKAFTRTDVPTAEPTPEPAVAVRTAVCSGAAD